MNPIMEAVPVGGTCEDRFWEYRVVAKLGMGVGHDMNNHLVTVVGLVDYMMGRMDNDSPEGRILADIARSAQLASQLAQDYMRLAMEESPRPTPQDLVGILSQGKTLLKATMPPGVAFEMDPCKEGPMNAEVSPPALLRLLAAICRMAGDSAGRGNRVRLSCEPDSRMIRIAICSPDAKIDPIPDRVPDSPDVPGYDMYYIQKTASRMGMEFRVNAKSGENLIDLELFVNKQ